MTRGATHISDNARNSALATAAEPQSVATKKASRRRLVWGGRTFRLNFGNFRPDKSLSLRRFSIVEAALLLILGLMASRGLGVVRQTIFNALFGTGAAANAFYASSRLPDTLFNLIAGGALTHAFIPVFLAYEKDKGREETWKLVSLVFNLMFVVLTLLALIGEFIAPAFVNNLLVPGYPPAERALTTNLTRIMLFHPLILGLGTIVTAVLNSKRQFLLPAISIAIYNVGLIGGLLVSLAVPGVGIYGPTYGTLVAALLQVGVQIPALLRQEGIHYSFVWNPRHSGLGAVLRMLIPNSLAVGVGYVALIIETAFVSYLPDPSSLAALHNAQMLQALPLAIISQAVGQALLPHLAVQAAAGRYVRVRQTAVRVITVCILLTIPAVLLLDFLGAPVIHLIFQHGAFNSHSSALTTLALFGYIVGLPGQVAGDLLTRAFYALQDARTPLLTNVFNVLTALGLIAVLSHVLHDHYIILSLPLALSGGATAEALLLLIILFFRLRKRVKTDAGMQRLLCRRELAKNATAR
jgi:putative peptidoglycan lipid II flippase